MVLILNKTSLYSTFGVEDFISLDVVINNMAPSMVEYYLSDLSNGNDDIYLNKRNIQSTINIGEYSLYLDYDDEVYIEIEDNVEDEYGTGSLW